MGVNKVVFGAVAIMDISDSTVTPETLAKGATAYDKSGEKITGTMESGGSSGGVNLDAPIIFEVEKITSNTYAGSTTYNNESFILLDVYPKSGGTVNIMYGGLTKTITDDGTSAEPNAQQVFFGTFNGVTDDVATPASGVLIIEGDCRGVGIGAYNTTSKATNYCSCVSEVIRLTSVTIIPPNAFRSCDMKDIVIPDGVTSIGSYAFYGCLSLQSVLLSYSVEVIGSYAFGLSSVSSVTIPSTNSLEEIQDNAFYSADMGIFVVPSGVTTIGALAFNSCYSTDYLVVKRSQPPALTSDIFANSNGHIPTILVPAGASENYKSAEIWNTYANYIVEGVE